MAIYTFSGTGMSLLDAYGGGSATARPLGDALLYHTPSEIGFTNADGSRTYVYGEGFVWNNATGAFTAGTVAVIAHYDADGAYVDDLTGITGVSAAGLQAQFEAQPGSGSDGLSALLLAGDDRLDAAWHEGGVVLDGHAGNDWIRGSAATDTLRGAEGNDILIGGLGGDLLIGQQGNDRLRGGAGRDLLIGDSDDLRQPGGNDVLRGGGGSDELFAGSGNNKLFGGTGNDMLHGSTGSDVMAGGAGADSFDYTPFAEAPRPFILRWGNDVIRDFTLGTDHIDFTGADVGSFAWSNNADGNAVLTADANNSITFIGIDANSVSLDDLML